jgi:hypothetical protein
VRHECELSTRKRNENVYNKVLSSHWKHQHYSSVSVSFESASELDESERQFGYHIQIQEFNTIKTLIIFWENKFERRRRKKDWLSVVIAYAC